MIWNHKDSKSDSHNITIVCLSHHSGSFSSNTPASKVGRGLSAASLQNTHTIVELDRLWMSSWVMENGLPHSVHWEQEEVKQSDINVILTCIWRIKRWQESTYSYLHWLASFICTMCTKSFHIYGQLYRWMYNPYIYLAKGSKHIENIGCLTCGVPKVLWEFLHHTKITRTNISLLHFHKICWAKCSNTAAGFVA